ncbi:MAG: hypothetical protein HYS13_23020 [Planctomycetia bacterium]|nr:hypothetical protein [Planctomycetia bacterium]
MRLLLSLAPVPPVLFLCSAGLAEEKGKGKGPPADPRIEFLKKFDANGNGKLDPDERAKAKAARAKNDKN